jgi:Winged helix DNA-binding domain
VRHIGDDERRARIARRHALAPAARVADPLSAARALTALHATEPATVYLSLFARVDTLTVADVDRALYEERCLVKQLAMRRTLFAFPRELLPAAWGSASARVADQERRRTAKDAELGGLAADGEKWLKQAREAVLDRLADGSELNAVTLRTELPVLAGKVLLGAGTKWEAEVSLAPRVLGVLGAEGLIVRGRNEGHWRVSRPAWTLMDRWLGEKPTRLEAREGYAKLVRSWLRTFGPGTETDVVWWLGATKTAVRRALGDVGAVEVSLDGDGTGWVLADDLEPVDPVPDWAALLPVLDPTTMGWKQREFYLHPDHTPYLFDTNGNAGSTAWWNGRIVGCWVQDDAGTVQVLLREDPGAQARAAFDVEAERLTAFLDAVRVNSVYTSLLMRSALLP